MSIDIKSIQQLKGVTVKGSLFTCPICTKIQCQVLQDSFKCINCNFICSDIVSINNLIERSNNIQGMLQVYSNYGFDLTRLMMFTKVPIKGIKWKAESNKDINVWKQWVEVGDNLAVKTGKPSGIIVLDIDYDGKVIPKELLTLISKVQTLKQITTKGGHLFFKYDKDFPSKIDYRKSGYDIEICSGSSLITLFPSVILKDNKYCFRRFNLFNNSKVVINTIPNDLKQFLLDKKPVSNSVRGKGSNNYEPPTNISKFNPEDLKVNVGGRNTSMLEVGGLLRKHLSARQLRIVLVIINDLFLSNPLMANEINIILHSLVNYQESDTHLIYAEILKYIEMVEVTTSNDIIKALEIKKIQVDKCLSTLVLDNKIVKKSRSYTMLKKITWQEDISDNSDNIISTKIPYFNSVANFMAGDMILIGAQSGIGKTHVAINIIKQLIDEGVKPYYVSTESGSRYGQIAKSLGVNGKFFHATVYNIDTITLEDNAFTIIDWLLPAEYKDTDKTYANLNNQLKLHRGILFVFAQLTNTGEFFAPNLIKMFPSLVAKYEYGKHADGTVDNTNTIFTIGKIRDPKPNMLRNINTKYNPTTKVLELTNIIQNIKPTNNNLDEGWN